METLREKQERIREEERRELLFYQEFFIKVKDAIEEYYSRMAHLKNGDSANINADPNGQKGGH